MCQYIFTARNCLDRSYDSILEKNILQIEDLKNIPSEYKQNIPEFSIFRLVKYKILSKILFGKKRKYYKEKYKMFENARK